MCVLMHAHDVLAYVHTYKIVHIYISIPYIHTDTYKRELKYKPGVE